MRNIGVVIPAYNESKRIGDVLEQLKKKKSKIYVVDDGSQDNTFQVAQGYGVRCFKHRINLGKGAALKTGCIAAFADGVDAVVLIDSDGQHKVSDLDKFEEALNQKYDIVFGSRNWVKGVPLVRYLGNKFASVLINLLYGIYVSDLICGYRAMTKEAFKKLDLQSSNYGIETEMVARTGQLDLKYCEVSVETVYYDKFKGVSLLDAFGVLLSVLRWKITK